MPPPASLATGQLAPGSSEGRLGYIRVATFSKQTSEKVRTALLMLREQVRRAPWWLGRGTEAHIRGSCRWPACLCILWYTYQVVCVSVAVCSQPLPAPLQLPALGAPRS